MHQKPPAGTVWIDLDEGYRPHFTEDFVALYGANSLFTLAVADCLLERHVEVLVRAEKLAADTPTLQLGPIGALKSLVALLKFLSARNVEKPVVLLMQCALGHTAPVQFERKVDESLGLGAFGRWVQALERSEFSQADSLLVAQ